MWREISCTHVQREQKLKSARWLWSPSEILQEMRWDCSHLESILKEKGLHTTEDLGFLDYPENLVPLSRKARPP